jgi:hypothetical protein
MNTQAKKTIGKLSYTEVYQIGCLYRAGEPVSSIANKFNAAVDTIVDIGRGMRTTVYNVEGKPIFSGFAIEADAFCEKNKWSYKIAG